MSLKDVTNPLKCLDHNSKIVAICFLPQCQRRFLCKTCQKNHAPDHAEYVDTVDSFNEATSLVELERLSMKLEKEIKELSTNAQDVMERIDITFKELEELIVAEIREAKDSISMKIAGLIRPKSEIYGELMSLKLELQRLLPKLIKSKMEDRYLIDEYATCRYNIKEKIYRSTDLSTQVSDTIAKTKSDIAYVERFRDEVTASFETFKRETGVTKWLREIVSNTPVNSKMSSSLSSKKSFISATPSKDGRAGSGRSPGSDGSVTPFDNISMADTVDFGDMGYLDLNRVSQKGRIVTKHPGAKGENLEEIDGKFIVTTGDDGMICVWAFDKDSVKITAKVQGHNGRAHCIKWNHQDQLLISAGADYKVNLYTFDKKSGVLKATKTNKSHKSHVLALAWIEELKLYLSGGIDCQLFLVDSRTMEHVDMINIKKPIYAMCNIGDKRIAVAADKEVQIIPITPQSRIGGATFNINAHQQQITTMKWSESDNSLFTGSIDGQIKKWQVTLAGATLSNLIIQNVGRVDSLIPMTSVGKIIGLINGTLLAFINIDNGEIAKALPLKIDAKKGYSMLLVEKRREFFLSIPGNVEIWTLGDASL